MSQIKDFPDRDLTNPPQPDDFLYLITQGNSDWKILINVLLGRALTKEIITPLYELVAEDTYHTIRFTFPAAKVITVPRDEIVQYEPGIIIRLRNVGTLSATILPETGAVIINTKDGLVIPPHGEVNLTNVSANLWDASGDLTS